MQRRAELHLSLGEKTIWGRGYGTAAIRRIVQYGFEEFDLRRIFATPDEDNVRVLRCFEKCGFVREGVLRQHRLRYGQPVNMVMMAVLRDDYNP